MMRTTMFVAVVALGACGARDDGGALTDAAIGSDGNGSDGDASHGGGDAGGSGGDAMQVDDRGDPIDPVAVGACGGSADVEATLPLPIDPNSYGSYGDPPLMLSGDTTRVIYGASGTWMTAAHGSASTVAAPSALAGSDWFVAKRSLAGRVAAVWQNTDGVFAAVFDGTQLGTPIEIPCTAAQPYYTCDVRAAGDGHLWIAAGQTLYEQVGTTFENRGGPPIGAEVFDVDAAGTVWAGGGTLGAEEVFQVWKLAAGAGGWTKTGSLTKMMVGAPAQEIEGGFQIKTGTFAPDGSVHLWTDARCIGTGERNKLQLYIRSRDGVTWSVERLPDMTALLEGHVTWSIAAVWASDYDNARFVNMSSTPPIQDGLDWIYPPRQHNLIARCTDQNQPAFRRIAKTRLPGWTNRGYARFAGNGALTLLTTEGLTQVYAP